MSAKSKKNGLSTQERKTHDELALLAVKWLKSPRSRGGPGCQVAFSEARNGYVAGEIPDAIGYRAGVMDEGTILVEVKVSRSDFLADGKKPHREDPAKGIGKYRYYLAPEGLIKPDELPPRWGLIEATPKGRLKVLCGHVKPEGKYWEAGYEDVFCFGDRNKEYETSLLVRLIYRVGDLDEFNRRYREDQRIKMAQSKEIHALREQVRGHRVEMWRLERELKTASGGGVQVAA